MEFMQLGIDTPDDSVAFELPSEERWFYRWLYKYTHSMHTHAGHITTPPHPSNPLTLCAAAARHPCLTWYSYFKDPLRRGITRARLEACYASLGMDPTAVKRLMTADDILDSSDFFEFFIGDDCKQSQTPKTLM